MLPVEDKEGQTAAGEPGRAYRELFSWVETIVVSLVIVSLLFTFIIRPVRVEGDSMRETLHNGDILTILPFFYEAERGDIVVLDSHEDDKLYIKRIIATEGQTVDIDFVTGAVTVDGETLIEPYIRERTKLEGDVQFPLVVEKGKYFVMGDNRNHSEDSRFSSLGQVSKQDIIGEAIFRLYPFSAIGGIS